MDKYFLAIVALIVFSFPVILYVRISAKNSSAGEDADRSKVGADFTILE